MVLAFASLVHHHVIPNQHSFSSQPRRGDAAYLPSHAAVSSSVVSSSIEMARFLGSVMQLPPRVCFYLMTRLFKDIVKITLAGWSVCNSDKNWYGFWLVYFYPQGFNSRLLCHRVGYYVQSGIKSKVRSLE